MNWVKNSPKTSADLFLAMNHASSPNWPFNSLWIFLSFEKPQTADTKQGSDFRCRFGSAADDMFDIPFQIARDNKRPVTQSECIIQISRVLSRHNTVDIASKRGPRNAHWKHHTRTRSTRPSSWSCVDPRWSHRTTK